MGVVNDGQGDASLLSDHQDLLQTPTLCVCAWTAQDEMSLSAADGQTNGIAALDDNEARIVVLVQHGWTAHLFVRDDNLDLEEAVGRVFHKTSHLGRMHRKHPGYTADSSQNNRRCGGSWR